MDEKPKSLWKKSWKGPRGFFAWFVVLLAAAFLVIFSIGYTSSIAHPLGRLVLFAFLYAICWALAGTLIIAFIRWIFHWRNFKKFLFGLACFITLLALFYAEEDWRGKHDWEKFKREWEAKGERFDWQSIVPPPVPDDQNFALAPIWIESIEASYGSNVTWQRYGKKLTAQQQAKLVNRLQMEIYHAKNSHSFNVTIENPKTGNWTKGELTDLLAWQHYYRMPSYTNAGEYKSPFLYPAHTFTNDFPMAAQSQTPAQDVLTALSKYDSAIEELRQASQLPFSRFPLNYDGMPAAILLPHLAILKQCSLALQLRAIAELQNNESQKALDDVKLSLRLTDSIRTEPFLISHLVRLAILQITLQPIWEGLAEHKWSDAQLADLDSELAKLDFLADCQFAIRGERGLEIANIEFFRHPLHDPDFHSPRLYFIAPFFYLMQEFSNLSGSGGGENFQMGFQMLALGFGLSGWLDQNELRIAQFETKWYLPVVDEEAKTISQAKIRAADNALGQEIRHRTPENVLETLFMPALGGGVRKFAYAQSSVNFARVAIALERYRLAHGEFPESLDVLAPQFMEKIPHDIINGQPLHYRRTDDGQFVLYSVGWNETDDGGVVVFKKGSTPEVDINQGDWVWRYPAK